MKYIIVPELQRPDREWAILIPDLVQHYHAVNRPAVTALSAGQFRITRHGVETFGESTTLKLEPRPQDAALIARSIVQGGLATHFEHTVCLALLAQAAIGAPIRTPAVAERSEVATTHHEQAA